MAYFSPPHADPLRRRRPAQAAGGQAEADRGGAQGRPGEVGGRAAATAAGGSGNNESDNENASDSDPDDDYNDLGAGTVTSVPVADIRNDSKRPRVPQKHRLPVADSYEGNPAATGHYHAGGAVVSSGSSGVSASAIAQAGGGSNAGAGSSTAQALGRGKGPLAAREALLCKPKEVPAQLRCGVCHLVAEHPKASPTGRMYCAACIDAALAVRPVCPVTCDPLEAVKLVDVQRERPVLWAIFEQVEMRCAHHVHGCNWTGSYAMNVAHTKSCTFQSWVCKCTWCGQAVVANHMDTHLREECQQYRCPRCAVDHRRSENDSAVHLESTVVRLVLSADYRFGPSTPLDVTKMLTFHGRKKRPANVSRDMLFNLLRSCYLGWKKGEASEWDVRMVINAAMASKWFHDRHREAMCIWLKSMAVASGWVEDKYPGRECFDCPYCLEHGEWIGAECGTCGQRWDLNGEHAMILR